jgi:hypothetical protein
VAAGWGQVRQVGAEVKPTGLATVLGVKDVQFAGPVTVRAAEVVEEAVPPRVAIAAPAAVRAATPTVVPRAVLDQRPGQVLNTGNALGAVWDIFTWWHSSLSSTSGRAVESKAKETKTHKGNPTSLLQCLKVSVDSGVAVSRHVLLRYFVH